MKEHCAYHAKERRMILVFPLALLSQFIDLIAISGVFYIRKQRRALTISSAAIIQKHVAELCLY